ncbi:4a-hydroxytetrahydrobiopterin dehydratase [Microcoleus sp. FACHB-1515]|uniref:4a-hydroxytetrahydrobiopterin dehydratase n=1 Tax=Leptolyngbya sp. FACHB-1515 TaxID=2933931 RepID=UPI00168827D8|nr:4a-hydroxytetrahydrobiopterin dehydratase [Microcoleus sp. FACHB-1515]
MIWQSATSSLLAIATTFILSSNTWATEAPLHRLTQTEVTEQMQQLPGWTTDGQRIYCTYEFENFVEAIAFVDRLVAPAELAGHHPDIAIAYNKVTVSLTTHDVGGLTEQDFTLARQIDRLADEECQAAC